MNGTIVNQPIEDPLPIDCGEVYSDGRGCSVNEHEAKKFAKEIGTALSDSLRPVLQGLSPQSVQAQENAQTHSSWLSRLTWWQTLLGVIIAIGTIVGGVSVASYEIVKHVVSDELTHAFEQPNRDFASLRDRDVGGIRRDLDNMTGNVNRLQDWQTKVIFSGRTEGASRFTPEDIKTAAKQAVDRRISIPIDQVERASTSLLQGEITPAKWDAVTELANLRSFVNSTLSEANRNIVNTIRAEDLKNHPGPRPVPFVPGKWTLMLGPGSMVIGASPIEDAFFRERPGAEPMTLYGNVIFRNMHIRYDGGILTLINVFFDNCTFEIQQNPKGRAFMASVIHSELVNFKG
jgi:hypothetical protein